MVRRAQRQQILETRLAAVGPMVNVMCVEPARVVAAGERAAAIARDERALDRGRDDALLAADIQRVSGVIVYDRHDRAVATESPSRR
jgi:hypothetical protein